MLPFMKNKEASADLGEDEAISRKPDGEESFDMLDAVAEDMIAALGKKDKALLKSALQALVEHIQDEDVEQDQSQLQEGIV